MSSDKKCCNTQGCFKADGASQPVLHVFPNPNKDPERFEAWRSSVGGHILELTDEHIYKYRRVCHAHFEEKFHCRYNRLSNIAVPTVNLADESRRNEQFKENIPEAVSALSGDAPRPRKRPFACIDNVDACLPSTSKEFDRPAFKENKHYELQNIKIKAGLEYCSGYFAKKCREKVFNKCLECNKNMIDKNECEYINYREFEKKR